MTGSGKLRKENQSLRNEIAELKENLQSSNCYFAGQSIVRLFLINKVEVETQDAKIGEDHYRRSLALAPPLPPPPVLPLLPFSRCTT